MSPTPDSEDTDRPFEPRRARRQLLWLGVALFVGVAAVMWILIQIYGLAAVREGWAAIEPAVRAVKWAGLIVLIGQWDPFIRWVARRQRMHAGDRDVLLGMRWRVAGALVILEILFGQNLLAHLLN